MRGLPGVRGSNSSTAFVFALRNLISTIVKALSSTRQPRRAYQVRMEEKTDEKDGPAAGSARNANPNNHASRRRHARALAQQFGGRNALGQRDKLDTYNYCI